VPSSRPGGWVCASRSSEMGSPSHESSCAEPGEMRSSRCPSDAGAGSTLAAVAKRRRCVPLVVALGSVIFVSLCADSALGAVPTEPGYACSLVHTSLVSASFGKGLRAQARPTKAAAGPGGDSYSSGCTVSVTKKRKGAPSRKRRYWVGTVQLTTEVAAEGAPGEKWSAAAQQATEISFVEQWISSFGGSVYPMDSFGQTEVHAYLLGSKEISTEAFWRHEENGEISISLRDRSEFPSRLERLLTQVAAGIVPEFLG
jgi:hypothetical protein